MRWLIRYIVVSICVGGLLLGCANPGKLGDRAFYSGNYKSALDYYERALEDGSRDPELYYHAALASTRLGNFASAERYYSLSLRYGGDLEVARSLAEFYVQTSNYAQAVRVFQYLLRHEEDPQPIYNNLGTALMYAGLPFDAESYLIIAQNSDPGSATPYMNLGLLYDRHFKQPSLAIAFYQCYVSLSQDESQRRVVQTRIQEMELRRPRGYADAQLVCGEPYQPVHRGLEEIRQLRHDTEPLDMNEPREVVDLDWDGDAKADENNTPGDSSDVLDLMKTALENRDIDAVGQLLPDVDNQSFDRQQLLEIARELLQNGKVAEAVNWMELSIRDDLDSKRVRDVLSLYTNLERTAELESLCERIRALDSMRQLREDYCIFDQ